MPSARERVRDLLNPRGEPTFASRVANGVIVAFIVVSTVQVVLESEATLRADYGPLFAAVDAATVGVFVVEYLARLWSATADPRYRRPVSGRVRFALTPWMLVDLLAIVPSLLPMVGLDLRVLRLLRIFRLVRVLKLGRSTGAVEIIGAVLSRTREELLITLGFVAVLILIAASLMHAAEADAQPEVFGSIPDAMWWAVVTLTTVGYGDAYPVTLAGRMIAGVLAVLGIGLVGMPAGILGAGFMQEMDARKRASRERSAEKVVDTPP